eukprot:TRINITY_DN1728_c0_g1_i6.p1 TRINITY_DN1728_c0_g1~~TRINITY_DN1728_c0_g1_i6.p1  ORF type:complete len:2245 (+),score=936.44 TRINITY_DN1728_c0_g1_i6:1009-6735(+)
MEDTQILQSLSGGHGCAALGANREVTFLEGAGGQVYRYDRRVKLASNTNAAGGATTLGATVSPGNSLSGDYDEYEWCPSVAMNPFNEDACVTDAACGVVSCGARGEVTNDPNLGHRFTFRRVGKNTDEFRKFEVEQGELDGNHKFETSKQMEFHNIAVFEDMQQLRYRVAWALYQILPISEDVGRKSQMDVWNAYMDIFVDNAFGNYRDILHRVAYHPMQGYYLTFLNNKAYAASGSLPDQNFAREIMQLFSIGLSLRDLDGSLKDGVDTPTYDTKDIVTMARAWTGFTEQENRGNVESVDNNWNDFMRINAEWRDAFPKLDLFDNYIGDGYPLCADAPAEHYLKAGAKYVYAGGAEPEGDEAPSGMVHLEAPAGSGLHAALAPSGTVWPAVVTLEGDASCPGCAVLDDVAFVEVRAGGATRYYRYVKPACVKMAVFTEGRVTAWKTRRNDDERENYQCADVQLPLAGAGCCNGGGRLQSGSNNVCEVSRERMLYGTAEARCAGKGLQLCTGRISSNDEMDYDTTCAENQPTWLDDACSMQVQVWEDGQVGLVASVSEDPRLQASTLNTFYPAWAAGFPTTAGAGCTAEGETMLCTVTVTSEAVYPTAGDVPATVADVEAQLRIGAFDPAALGGYSCETSCGGSADVAVYSTGAFGVDSIVRVKVDATLGGGFRYYLNRVDTVTMEDGAGVHSFRNAPTFMGLSGEAFLGEDKRSSPNGEREWLRFTGEQAAHRETSALIDHLFHHPNMPSFIAHLMIQRLVTSNPSPRYLEAASTAFKTGVYGSGGSARGSGRYGCMEAMLAAILLDREARSLTLDADPGHGAMREPILKVLHVFRAMEVQTEHGDELRTLLGKIGQDLWESPSVFGFYLPSFSPSGPLERAGLVSPENQLAIAPQMYAMMNSLSVLVRRGLVDESFGLSADVQGGLTYDATSGGGYADAGMADAAVDALDVLLCDGRLSAASKAAILSAAPLYTALPPTTDLYACPDPTSTLTATGRGDKCMKGTEWTPPLGCYRDGSDSKNEGGVGLCSVTPDAGRSRAGLTKVLLEMMLFAPEFHTTNLRVVDTPRSPAGGVPPAGVPYKAVVALAMEGGVDSWNSLIPASGCTAPLSFAQYSSRRGEVAIDATDLGAAERITPNPAHAPPVEHTPGQPCASFYMSFNLTDVAAMFRAGDAAVFGNVGNMIHPFTRATMDTAERPEHGSAHNFAQRHMMSMWPQMGSGGKGVLGRMADALAEQGVRANLYSIGNFPMIVSSNQVEATVLDRREGASELLADAWYSSALVQLLADVSQSHFAETYGASLLESLEVSTALRALLADVPAGVTSFAGTDKIGEQFELVSRIMAMRDGDGDRLADRDFFVVQQGGFDSHHSKLQPQTKFINDALVEFRTEMVRQGTWEATVVVAQSDFARTINSNGHGTDHAWGGNYFAVGGSIRDQTMLSPYVPSLEDGHEQAWGHGIFVPAWGYEVYWAPIVDWFGVPKDRWYNVLPNLPHFPPICRAHLFDKEDGTPHIGEVVCDMPAVTPGPPTPPPTPAPTPPALQPLGAFAPTCPSVAYLEAGVGGMKALTYTLGKVGAADAVLFEMRLEDGAWGGVGFRSASAGASMMKGLDIIAVDTADGVVHDYDEAQYAAAPFESSFTQTALRSHTRDGTDHVVAFYRLFENGVDFTLRAGVDLNIAAAAGAGTLSPWGMHSHYAQRDHTFTVCAASPRPDAPGADVPNTAVPSTGIPGTVAPGSPPGATARPSTSPHTTTTGEPTTAAPPGDPASKAPGNETTREPADPNQLGAAENGGGGGVATWLVVVLAFVGGLLCVGVAAALVARSRRQTVSFGEAMSTSGNLMSPSAATPLPLQPSQPDVPLRPTTVAADDESHAPTPVYTPPTAELPKAPHLPLLPLRPASTAGSNVLTML